MGANWPEFRSCFGIFSLKTGVYIIAVAGLIITGTSVILNCIIFSQFLRKREEFFDPENGFFQNRNISDERLQRLMFWSSVASGYYAVWILMKFLIFLTKILLLYGAWKNKAKMLKIYLYINVPYWVVNTINAIISTYFFSAIINILTVIGVLIDCIRLLIIRSAYREMTGKLRFLESSSRSSNQTADLNYNRFENPPRYEPPINNNQSHCSTCSCSVTPINSESTIRSDVVIESPLQSPVSEVRPIDTNIPVIEVIEQKPLNFKDGPRIYDQNQLAGCSNYVIEEEEIAINNNANDIPIKVEKDVSDIPPVIFDQTQLNIGLSPIIEDPTENISGQLRNIDSTTNINSQTIVINQENLVSSEIIKRLKKKINENNLQSGQSKTEIKKAVRPTTLELNVHNKKKKGIEEIPVIYDELQLKMGSSPIIEDSLNNL